MSTESSCGRRARFDLDAAAVEASHLQDFPAVTASVNVLDGAQTLAARRSPPAAGETQTHRETPAL